MQDSTQKKELISSPDMDTAKELLKTVYPLNPQRDAPVILFRIEKNRKGSYQGQTGPGPHRWSWPCRFICQDKRKRFQPSYISSISAAGQPQLTQPLKKSYLIGEPGIGGGNLAAGGLLHLIPALLLGGLEEVGLGLVD